MLPDTLKTTAPGMTEGTRNLISAIVIKVNPFRNILGVGQGYAYKFGFK